jgi:hypothetical protein
MSTWADYIRGLESQTMGGRLGSYLQNLDVGPLGYMNPAVRATARNWFDPMSSRYLLASAPGSMGGYGGWQTGAETAGQPTGSTFSEYLGQPMGYAQGAGASDAPWGYTTPTQDTSTGAGYLQAFQPWTRGQWAGRLGQMNLGAAADLTPEQTDYLSVLSMPETQSMIGSATMAGMNPIAQRAYRPGLSRAMSAWQMANPELGAGELLRQFATGGFYGNTGGYMPGVTDTTGPTTFL